jgi:hypothetical protein
MKAPTKDTHFEIGMQVLVWNHHRWLVRKIKRITDAYVEICGSLYRKDGGYLRGRGDWNTMCFNMPEDGDIENLQSEQAIVQKLGKVHTFARDYVQRRNNGLKREDKLQLYQVLVDAGFIQEEKSDG